MPEPSEARVTRDDIEARLRALKGQVDERTAAAKRTAAPALAVGAVFVLIIAYLFGKRVGKRKSTVVEIRRV